MFPNIAYISMMTVCQKIASISFPCELNCVNLHNLINLLALMKI